MVQVVENWAQVTGTIAAVAPSPRAADWLDLVFEDPAVSDVEGFPNLVAAAPRPLRVRCPSRTVAEAGLAAGQTVSLRVRLGGPGDLLAGPIESGSG